MTLGVFDPRSAPAYSCPAMGTSIHPHGWNEFFEECLWYFVPLGAVHIAAFFAGSLVIAALSWRRRGILMRRIRRFGLFLALLLAAGSIFNGVWSCAVWGRLYYSTDYVLDFTPFWPITQSVIDTPFGDQRGRLFGVTLTQLNMVWLLFSLGTWGGTMLMYREVLRRKTCS